MTVGEIIFNTLATAGFILNTLEAVFLGGLFIIALRAYRHWRRKDDN